jgi:hypothetical protein
VLVVWYVDSAYPGHACPRSKKFAIVLSNLLIFKPKRGSPDQPWRCLCRWFLQITRTTPFLRTTLQLRQILFTDASTFMFVPR